MSASSQRGQATIELIGLALAVAVIAVGAGAAMRLGLDRVVVRAISQAFGIGTTAAPATATLGEKAVEGALARLFDPARADAVSPVTAQAMLAAEIGTVRAEEGFQRLLRQRVERSSILLQAAETGARSIAMPDESDHPPARHSIGQIEVLHVVSRDEEIDPRALRDHTGLAAASRAAWTDLVGTGAAVARLLPLAAAAERAAGLVEDAAGVASASRTALALVLDAGALGVVDVAPTPGTRAGDLIVCRRIAATYPVRGGLVTQERHHIAVLREGLLIASVTSRTCSA